MKLPDFFGFLKKDKQTEDPDEIETFKGKFFLDTECMWLSLPHNVMVNLKEKKSLVLGCGCESNYLRVNLRPRGERVITTGYR